MPNSLRLQDADCACVVHGAGCGTLYVYLNLPETKGISLAAIQVLLQDERPRVEKPDARSHIHTVI